jgi:NAD(P)-dependent dehydrogenase (short-subunit alcohol dehydrogenase family)
MANRVAGKVAIVTGGGSGMGRAGATLLAAEGARVVVADVNQERAERIAQSIVENGGEAVAIPVDVCESSSVEQLVARTVVTYGRVDVLYHNAVDGKFVNEQDRRITEMPDETWHRMINLILSGTYRCCKYVGRQMLAQKSGSIILSATVDALIGCAGLDSYTAAKGGVVALTRSFAAGMAKDGVRVNAICPGFVSSETQLSWLENPGARATMDALHLLPIATPEQVAPFVLYLASDESDIVTGGIFPIDSGYMAFKAKLDVTGTQGGQSSL